MAVSIVRPSCSVAGRVRALIDPSFLRLPVTAMLVLLALRALTAAS